MAATHVLTFRGHPREAGVDELRDGFQRRSREWGIRAALDVSGGRVIATADPGLSDDKSAQHHARYATALFQAGLLERIEGAVRGGRPFRVPLESGRRNGPAFFNNELSPIYSGPTAIGKKKGGSYTAVHLEMREPASIAVARTLDGFVDYPASRYFAFLPHHRHAENFALASRHLMDNPLSDVLPFAVGFIDAVEKTDHAVISELQANFSKRLVAGESPLDRRREILAPKVDREYSHWSRILLRHVFEHYLSRGMSVLFPDPESYVQMWGVAPERADAIIKGIESAAKGMGLSSRALTDAEKVRWQMRRAKGYRVISPP